MAGIPNRDEAIQRIGAGEYINCVLVEKGARRAWMLQPQDYAESGANSPKTSEKLAAITHFFPSLVQTITSHGIIISKIPPQPPTAAGGYTSADIGNIIGYICAEEFENILNRDEEESSVTYTINVKFSNGSPDTDLLATRCKDERTQGAHERLRFRIEQVLKKDKRTKGIVSSVELVKDFTVPVTVILRKLVNKEPLSDHEKSEMMNYIYNIGFTEGGEFLEYEFDETNEFHRGILLTLITHYIHNPMEPLFPITQFGDEKLERVEDMTRQWERLLYKSIEEGQGGGRRRRYEKTRKGRKQGKF
jgi:hypothetical protein